MSTQEVINELHALEIYFDEGRKRARKARRDLEDKLGHLNAPGASGVDAETEAKVLDMVAKRTVRIIKENTQ